MTTDAFGTEALRRAVTEAWAASPTRFREDANTEDDFARGHYRGRVVVELAQNAADAAARARIPGRLLLRVEPPAADGDSWHLVALNTGAPLDREGVESLASMRASAKQAAENPTVGRFGVGFAALRAVADDIRIGSGDRSVEFSLARTRTVLQSLAAGHAGIAQELNRRGVELPALRLPFSAVVEVPEGWTTAVRLQLRDDAALVEVRAQLAAVDDALLLAMPALAEVVIEDPAGPTRRWADVARRWTVARRSGRFPTELLDDLPVENRRQEWSVMWAVPADAVAGGPRPSAQPPAVHAPTPTDEPTSFPALLIASFPLSPSRRHIVAGRLADAVAAEAGRAYADLLVEVVAVGGSPLDWVPAGMPAGAIDAVCRVAAVEAIATTPLLAESVPVEVSGRLIRPDEAVAIAGGVGADPAMVDALAPLVGNLVVLRSGQGAAARALGMAVVTLADLVEELPMGASAAEYRAVYAAAAAHLTEPGVLDALAGIPVPLLDGRTVRGARGLLLGESGTGDGTAEAAKEWPTVAVAGALDLRIVDPAAAHPLLERLGARPGDPGVIVGEPGVREQLLELANEWSVEIEHALRIVASAAVAAGHGLPFWWGELPVATADGPPRAARECALPGSWAARVLDLPLVDSQVIADWGSDTLRAVGVREEPSVYRVADVLTPLPGEDPADTGTDPQAWLSDWSGYLDYLADELGPGVFIDEIEAVADLDTIADDQWQSALAAISADPVTRQAVLSPVRSAAGTAWSYAGWWLRTEVGAPFALDRVTARFLPGPSAYLRELDEEFLVAIGGVNGLDELAPADWTRLWEILPAVGESMAAADALVIWRAVEFAAADGGEPDQLPDRLPALGPDGVVMVAAREVVVARDPMWAQCHPVFPARRPERVAAYLDLGVAPPAGQEPDDVGEPRALALAIDDAPSQWWEHTDLRVAGRSVSWWLVQTPDGPQAHAVGLGAAARAIAAATGRYERWSLVAELLRDPWNAERAIAETAWAPEGFLVEPDGDLRRSDADEVVGLD